MSHLNEYWFRIKSEAYDLLRSYNIKDGLFLFQNKHTTANNIDLRNKSKDKLVALEYCLVRGYCISMFEETQIDNLYKITDKGLNFIFEYQLEY